MKSQVCKIANQLVIQYHMSRPAAFRQAWAIMKLKQDMKNGPKKFVFMKKNGERRPAIGTLDVDYSPKGAPRKSNPLQIKYFDLEREAFRSFNAAYFVHS